MAHREYKLISQSQAADLKEFCASRNSFTLVELMVVLAIIAMLAGLLTMTIRDGRERARATHCRNNLRQFGIAIGKYKSDWDGYFMQSPVGGASASEFGGTKGIPPPGAGPDDPRIMVPPSEAAGGTYDVSPYEAGLLGGVGTALGFVSGAGYDPYFIEHYVLSGNPEKNVTHCPAVDREIFNTNSPSFKGLYSARDPFTGQLVYNEDPAGGITTYAINAGLSGRLSENAFAYIDWNAAQGWGASVGWGTASWCMDKNTVGSAVKETVYKDAGTEGDHPSKSDVSFRTEIGYHHRSGTNRIANYAAVDGHVGSISFNASTNEFQQLFYGK